MTNYFVTLWGKNGWKTYYIEAGELASRRLHMLECLYENTEVRGEKARERKCQIPAAQQTTKEE